MGVVDGNVAKPTSAPAIDGDHDRPGTQRNRLAEARPGLHRRVPGVGGGVHHPPEPNAEGVKVLWPGPSHVHELRSYDCPATPDLRTD
jgi:hypothetical protein